MNKKKMKKISNILLTTAILSQTLYPSSALSNEKTAEGFADWLETFKEEILTNNSNHKISKTTIEKAFANTHFIERAIKSDKNQAEFKPSFQNYLDKYISNYTVKKGIELRRKNYKIFDTMEYEYNINRSYLIALWNAETGYGNYFGNQQIISSTATLAYEGRRETFFKKQYISALKIAEQNDFDIVSLKGSWAGGLGNFQFIPTTFEANAVDYNFNGKIDLWNEMGDAFASASNLLKNNGWEKGKLWGREVSLPDDFDEANIDTNGKKDKQTVSYFKSLGVKKIDGTPLPNSSTMSRIIKTNDGAKTYIVYNNFEVIRKWNRSNHYALMIGIMHNRLMDEQNNK